MCSLPFYHTKFLQRKLVMYKILTNFGLHGHPVVQSTIQKQVFYCRESHVYFVIFVQCGLTSIHVKFFVVSCYNSSFSRIFCAPINDKSPAIWGPKVSGMEHSPSRHPMA